jgi:tocopherol cyclase
VNRFRRTLHPACYHGENKKPPFFEGWYFKLIDQTGAHRIALIPGVALHKDPSDNHCFIQFLDGMQETATYSRFSLADFQYVRDDFDIRMGKSRFTTRRIEIDLMSSDLQIRGDLSFSGLKPWPVKWWSPGIMGWYAWVPFMECFHGVLSMDHEISGQLELNGEVIDFSGGRGYIEKDWGRSFPSAYIWTQCNHFGRTGVSLSASVAIIPWIRRPFPGFIVGLQDGERLYPFATYNGSKIVKLNINDQSIEWVLKRRKLFLHLQIERKAGGILKAPTIAGMEGRVAETMDSTVQLQLTDRSGGRDAILFQGKGVFAAMEAAGDLGRLINLWRDH